MKCIINYRTELFVSFIIQFIQKFIFSLVEIHYWDELYRYDTLDVTFIHKFHSKLENIEKSNNIPYNTNFSR
jgi:hypothetical protein